MEIEVFLQLFEAEEPDKDKGWYYRMSTAEPDAPVIFCGPHKSRLSALKCAELSLDEFAMELSVYYCKQKDAPVEVEIKEFFG